MNYSRMRDFILKSNSLYDALNMLVSDDLELRRHLESLLILEWENGFKVGAEQEKSNIAMERMYES